MNVVESDHTLEDTLLSLGIPFDDALHLDIGTKPAQLGHCGSESRVVTVDGREDIIELPVGYIQGQSDKRTLLSSIPFFDYEIAPDGLELEQQNYPAHISADEYTNPI